MVTYVFDGSMEGLLTAVFDCYDQRAGKVAIVAQRDFMPSLIGDVVEIVSDEAKAKRVWIALRKKFAPDDGVRFYKAFLSESAKAYQHLFDLARYLIDNKPGASQNFGNPDVLAIAQFQKSVDREKHRMKAFIRFQETADGIFYAGIDPDFNVLPLIANFFTARYADQKWIIYDLKRKYGLYYDLSKTEEISLDMAPQMKTASGYIDDNLLHDKEQLYGLLWNDYFKSTNIPARKNMKLHIRHVPKRYWKYLTEKRADL